MIRKEKTLPVSTIYVELDALLDTRWGTLVRYYKDDVVEQVLTYYHNRGSDYLKYLNASKFLERYKERDVVTILNSVVTPVMKMIKEFVSQTLKNVVNSPYHYQPKVLLNTHPYKLTDNDIAGLLSIIRFETGHHADIEVVNYPVEDLDPEYINHHLAIMVMYHYDKWVKHFTDNERFIKVQCPSVSLFAPRINFWDNTTVTDEEYDQLMMEVKPIIDLHLLPAEHFSLVLRKQPEEKKEETSTT